MDNGCIEEREEYTLKTFEDGSKITVRDLQMVVLDIMDEVHRVCIKNDIKYALIAGSALGIVNYKGFIPWDDDIDVCIEKKDWARFVEAMKKDLSDKYYFQCFETDKRYNVLIPSMKVRKKGTCIEEVNFLLKNRCKSGDGIFVDVVIYDNIADNKWVDEFNRTKVKLLMPIMVLLDNLHFNPKLLKKWVVRIATKYGEKHKNSKLTSQTIAIPWEKFLHEPVFLKEDVYPFKLYEFEGRKFYSYNNIEKVLKEWYGPNCLKKWDGKKWVETLPVEKRKPKHTVNLSLTSDKIER
ncbi:MAG: LicD family protein [Bacilli bacterium]|nr:LicD family protein [Bacilli bacterium]